MQLLLGRLTVAFTFSIGFSIEFLKVSVGYIYNVRASDPENYDKIPKGHKVGRHVIWLKSEVLEWISQH